MNHHRFLYSGLLALTMLVTALLVALAPVSAQGVTFTEIANPAAVWDATSSPDGSIMYYTGSDADGAPAVFSIPAGGGAATIVAHGSPFALPFGIDISTDGKTLYVGDPWTAGTAGNAIFALPSDGSGAPTPVMGTWGTEPQGVTVLGDDIYFSGINLDAGEPAIYKIAAAGADAPEVLAMGAPLVAPAGIAVADDGTVYVLDRLASGGGRGSVLRIRNGVVETIASDVRTGGQMPGVALTLDGSTLLVSSLDDAAGTAQVLTITLGTLEKGIINDVIKANNGAGGLHRAHEAGIFAWCGYSDPPLIQKPGHVYVVGT